MSSYGIDLHKWYVFRNEHGPGWLAIPPSGWAAENPDAPQVLAFDTGQAALAAFKDGALPHA